MQERLTELFGDRLALRIGVNTGEVVIGKPREGSSFATGDPVNVTARLEQAARPGQVLVGERTALLVGGAFEFAEPVTVEAKGKPGGVACRELVRMVAPRRPRGGRALGTGFVGRTRELYGSKSNSRGPRLRNDHSSSRSSASPASARRASSGSSWSGSLIRRGSGSAAASPTVAA